MNASKKANQRVCSGDLTHALLAVLQPTPLTPPRHSVRVNQEVTASTLADVLPATVNPVVANPVVSTPAAEVMIVRSNGSPLCKKTRIGMGPGSEDVQMIERTDALQTLEAASTPALGNQAHGSSLG